jgi:hypothetical protein
MLFDVFKLSLSKISITDWKNKKFILSSEDFLYTQETKTEKINSFLKIFNEDIKKSLKEYGVYEYKILDVWSLSYEKDKFHQIHNHRTLGFTGIIYVDFNEDEHHSTKFIIPWNDPVKDSINIFSLDSISEGDMIIFPSSLIHFTDPNFSNLKRRIVAFDLIPLNNNSYLFVDK